MMIRRGVAVAVLGICLSLLLTPPTFAASTDNFTIANYQVDMTLSKDGSQRSVLRATETITADFTVPNQNHGLERVFVKEYDGHPTHFQLDSVTDEQGNTLPYHWSDDVLRIGDADTYVQGQKTYKISYTQRDVTKYYKDTGKTEFYWDAIGVEWRVPIQSATINLTLAEGLTAQTTPYCYYGATGSTARCDVTQQGATYSATQTALAPGAGMTLALGFAQGEFAAYQPTLFDRLKQWFFIATIVGWVATFVITVGLFMTISRWSQRKKDIGTIVPEYIPPADASVTASASVLRSAGMSYKLPSVMPAQLIDLAVRHYIKLYEVAEKKWYKAAEYEVEIIKDLADLRWEERELLSDMFDGTPAVGQRKNLKELQGNTGYYVRTQNNDTDLDKRVRSEYGLKEPYDAPKSLLRKAAIGGLAGGVLLLSWPLLMLAAVATIASFVTYYRLSDKGVALHRYLEGLKLYISVAEQERLQMLQSPDGAQKVGDDTSEAKRVVLYERVLPYAILFGKEQQWTKQLADYYQQIGQEPGWYNSHSGVFSAAAFSSGLSGLSSATSSASSASSSTGGSSGGGSSGGGGGGGGGGGW